MTINPAENKPISLSKDLQREDLLTDDGGMFKDEFIEYLLNDHIGIGNPESEYWTIGIELGTKDGGVDIDKNSPHELRLKRVADILRYWSRGSKDGLATGRSVPTEAHYQWMFGKVCSSVASSFLHGDLSRRDEYLRRCMSREAFSMEWNKIVATGVNSNQWVFHGLTGLPGFTNRREYEHTYTRTSCDRMVKAIRKYKPALVVMGTRTAWRAKFLADRLDATLYSFMERQAFFIIKAENTLILCVTQNRPSNSYLQTVVEKAREFLA